MNVNEIYEDIRQLKNTLKLLLIVVFISLAVISSATIVTVRTSADTKKVGQQNRTFLGNFSDYMRCLVVVDEPAYDKLGKEKYFDECDKLLFRNTGQAPHKHDPVPTTSTTLNNSTTSGSNIIGG